MQSWPSDYVEANGIRMHYYRTGGDKPQLVLAHGLTDHGLCWLRTTQALAADYDIIMLDARGHGHSDAPESGYGPLEHAADVAAVIEALGLEKPVLMGHSMGGVTAGAVAAMYPHLVSRIIVEDPAWRHDRPPTAQQKILTEEWRKEAIGLKSKSRDELIALGQQRNPKWDNIEFGPWVEAKQLVNPKVFDFILAENDWEASIPKIACPTLLVTGEPEQGGIVTSESAQHLTEINPNLQHTHIAGAGHNIRREQFEAFIRTVRGVLG